MACEKTTILSKNTNLSEVIATIKKYTIEGSLNPEIKKIATQCLLNSDPVKCAFDRIYNTILYSPDPDGRQIVKAVHCTLADKRGNCVDYSIVLGAILIDMEIPYSFKVVSFDNSDQFDHIYIKLKNGIILDPVLGQRQDGTDTFQNRPISGHYNKETDYIHSKEFPMTTLEVLQGTRRKILGKSNYMQSRNEANRIELARKLAPPVPTNRVFSHPGFIAPAAPSLVAFKIQNAKTWGDLGQDLLAVAGIGDLNASGNWGSIPVTEALRTLLLQKYSGATIGRSRSRRLGSTTAVYTTDPNTQISDGTNRAVMQSSKTGNDYNIITSWGVNMQGIEMFFNDNTLFVKNAAGQAYTTNGGTPAPADMAYYMANLAIANPAAIPASVSSSVSSAVSGTIFGLPAPVVVVGGVGLAGLAIWYFFFKK